MHARTRLYVNSTLEALNSTPSCHVYFHNATDGISNQLVIESGSYISETGPWYDLGSSQTIYIAITAEANSTGTSNIYTYLEIRYEIT